MERNINKDLQELFKVLKSFPLEDFDSLILSEFPEIPWDVLSQEEMAAMNGISFLKSSSLAMKIVEHLKESGIGALDVQNKIALLKMLKMAKYSTQDWHAYEMREQISTVNSDTMVPRIGRSLKIAMRQYGLRPVVHTYKLNSFIWLSVGSAKVSLMKNMTGRKRTPVYFALQPGSPFLFIAPRVPEEHILQAFVHGLGYGTCRDRKLKGRDLHSLLRIIDRKRNIPNPEAVNSTPTYNPYPVNTGRGIDFTNMHPKVEYLESILGKDPPLINLLEIEGRCPMPEEIGGHITTVVRLISDDATAAVKEMVINNVMRPNSVMVKLLQSNRNQIVLPD